MGSIVHELADFFNLCLLTNRMKLKVTFNNIESAPNPPQTEDKPQTKQKTEPKIQRDH